ncbi:SDR family oxidoreductase [Williamsia phyllosphaerae]|uniref:NAD-dependent epimerase/dehydratase n=1 Tax=Williamsia phyllosphaerae TaxID=885042 RepID=A0ABQ1UJW8_9NOCA|nr:SDR family oxidoreductase [Williamsia phyllosphaerae]GGF20869.1 putative NAD-dependent epimerase/dehydratase [Williamsia phyllosphaerae]
MRVFVTGGSGFIGSAVVRELIEEGHDVIGLARSDRAAEALSAAGAAAHRGSLTDAESLRTGADMADGVIHLAGAYGQMSFADAVTVDRQAMLTLGGALEGSDRPLVFASATSMIAPGRVITEGDVGDDSAALPRRETELAVLALAERGVRVVVVRLATLVHGDEDSRGFIPMLVQMARTSGVSAYIGDGRNRWPAVHQRDAARLFRIAVERAPAGTRLHAIAEEGIDFRVIAEAVGRGAGVPTVTINADRAGEQFPLLDGPLALLTGTDIPASSAVTRELLDWVPRHPDLLSDLEAGFYFRR